MLQNDAIDCRGISCRHVESISKNLKIIDSFISGEFKDLKNVYNIGA